MSRIRSHMRLMEPVDEPERFAEKVGEHLKRRFPPARILRRLFVPPHVKLPIGAAAIAVIVLLVVYTLGIMNRGPIYEISVSLVPTEDSEVVEIRGHKRGPGNDREKGEVADRSISFEILVESLGGRVVKSDYGEGADTPRSLTIEIRAGDYSTLLARLSRLGVVEEPYAGIAEANDELIRVKILLQDYTLQDRESDR